MKEQDLFLNLSNSIRVEEALPTQANRALTTLNLSNSLITLGRKKFTSKGINSKRIKMQ
jgi:hypothetical protein